MINSVIIFEDHTFENFRPLALSVPVYEIRMGMFNLRERIELVGKDLDESGSKGILLCRDILAPLHTCEQWQINPESFPQAEDANQRFIWLSGRCLATYPEIRSFLGSTKPGEGFACTDEHGLLAADLGLQESQDLWKSWCNWSSNKNKGSLWDFSSIAGPKSDSSPDIKGIGHIWDIVPNTSEQLDRDLEFLKDGKTYSRRPFGVFPAHDNSNPFWLEDSFLKKQEGEDLWVGEQVQIASSVEFDTTNGPIILDHHVKIMPHCFLEGPLYVGPGCLIKAGATIYGESSFGIGNRLSGEIGESTFSDFANKQHDGFIGHAVLGSWTNLGAMTTCSDLKNNYGNVRVDLGSGTVDTGLRFVGLMMGDHVKTAIGSLFNTGTCVGFASNIFGGVMPPKFVCNFSWGGLDESPSYDVNKAIETAAVVMSRRGCRLTEDAKKLFRILA